MLCLSGFELYSRWVPLHCHLSFAIKANFVHRDSFETKAELILTEYNRLFWNIKSIRTDLRMVSNHKTVQIRSSCKTGKHRS